MLERERLPERQDLFWYDHKQTEVNYSGSTRFQQAAFPIEGAPGDHIEFLIFTAIQHFSNLIEDRYGDQQLRLSGTTPGLNNIFIDLLAAMPKCSYKRFQKWFDEDIVPIARLYKQIKLNAWEKEKNNRMEHLNYFCSLSVVALVSEVISDYFEKHIDRLGRMATISRWILGRSLSLAFLRVEDDPVFKSYYASDQKTQEKAIATRRLFNPFILGFDDVADIGLIDEIIVGQKPDKLSIILIKRAYLLFSKLLGKSKRFECQHIKRALAESNTFFKLVQHPLTRRKIIQAIFQDKLFKNNMVIENMKLRLQKKIIFLLEQQESEQALILFAGNDKRLSEIFQKKAVRKQFKKLLKLYQPSLAKAVNQELNQCLKLINRSQRSWLGSITGQELLTELEDFYERYQKHLSQAEDFKMLRLHYGRNFNRDAKWLGIRLWRSYELRVNQSAATDKERFEFKNIWDARKAEVENSFAEGNMYLIRPSGKIYARGSDRRQHVIFMFADLRNSTETTMKLTKDTASYLSPYLTAVNSSAKQCEGHRIYFAGDGFAAYFNRFADAIRAAYNINRHFLKLRQASGEETLKKAKQIYQSAIELVKEVNCPEKVREVLDEKGDGLQEEVKSFLTDMACFTADVVEETMFKKLLVKAAGEYSMPRIDVGIALTCGQLFNAMVGEDGEEKIPIVISPQLTQAARLSGSSDIVKEYIDSHFPHPFPYSAYTWDKKLYNRGIVLTQQVYIELKQEVGIFPLKTASTSFEGEKLSYYEDAQLKRHIILRKCQEPVLLKGIEKECAIYEVAPPGSLLDKTFGRLESQRV